MSSLAERIRAQIRAGLEKNAWYEEASARGRADLYVDELIDSMKMSELLDCISLTLEEMRLEEQHWSKRDD